MSELISIAILAGLALWGIGFNQLFRVASKRHRRKGQLKILPRRSARLYPPVNLAPQEESQTELERLRKRRSS